MTIPTGLNGHNKGLGGFLGAGIRPHQRLKTVGQHGGLLALFQLFK